MIDQLMLVTMTKKETEIFNKFVFFKDYFTGGNNSLSV
jgi:hypothetical protein